MEEYYSGDNLGGLSLKKILGENAPDLEITDDLAVAAKDADVIIDFTRPSATVANIGAAKRLKTPIVIGTTGITDE